MPVAIPLAIGISAAAGLGGAALSSHAAGSAANAQAAAAEQAAQLQHQDAQAALDFQRQQYQTSLGMIQPFYRTGTQALGNLGYLMGLQSNRPTPFNTNPAASGAAPDPFAGLNAGPSSGASNFNFGGMPANKLDMLQRGSGTDAQDTLMQQPGATGAQFNPNAMEGMPGAPQAAGAPGLLGPPAEIGPGDGGPGSLGGDMPPGPGTGGITANGLPGQATTTADAGAGAAGTDQSGFGSLMQPFGEQFSAPTGATEQNDPGYQFRLNEGMKALQNSAAARGTLLTGGTAKDLSSFGQDYASNEYGNVYNRAMGEYLNRYNMFNQNQSNQFNRLAAISGIGQTSAGQLMNAGQGAANNISSTLLTSGGQIGQQINNAAAARASGYVGGANAYSSALGGLGNLASLYAIMRGQGLNAYNNVNVAGAN